MKMDYSKDICFMGLACIRLSVMSFVVFLILHVAAIAREDRCNRRLTDRDLPASMPLYTSVKDMPTDLDRMITRSGLGCIQIENRPCSAEKSLKEKLLDASHQQSVLGFLDKNYFKCQILKNSFYCLRAFEFFIPTPQNDNGVKINPDIIDTYAVKVCNTRYDTGGDFHLYFLRMERQNK